MTDERSFSFIDGREEIVVLGAGKSSKLHDSTTPVVLIGCKAGMLMGFRIL